MRLFGALVFGALFAASASARRSHHPHKRAILDECAYIDANLAVELNRIIGCSIPTLFANVQLCLCVSAVPAFVKTNAVAQLGTNLVGEDVVIDALVKLIGETQGHQTCSFPSNCDRSCEPTNPCSFTCKNGFVKQGNECVCPASMHICEGSCTTNACPSHRPRRRDLELADITCPVDHELCGVTSGSWRRAATECLNTMKTLESCGGCATTLEGRTGPGVDCTLIPHVDAVSCRAGKCHVTKCDEGYKPQGSTCVKL